MWSGDGCEAPEGRNYVDGRLWLKTRFRPVGASPFAHARFPRLAPGAGNAFRPFGADVVR